MKTTKLIIGLLCMNILSSQAQNASSSASAKPPALPSPTEYRVVSLGANHRVWQRETYEQGPGGQVMTHVHSYTELASGMNYQDASGQWQESQELIEAFSGGAVARKGQYQVIFADNLNSAGSIDMQTPDGKRLRSNILGLMYVDTATGDAALIAQVQDAAGELISSNQVLYPNAFEGVKADVQYTYQRGSFEQDVILREQPPLPDAYGMNPETTELEVLTEFIDPPAADVSDVNSSKANLESDQTVSWGATRLGRGKAFNLGGEDSPATVSKRYLNLNGRYFLLEKVRLMDIAPSLSKLPEQSSNQHPLPGLASKNPVWPKTPPVKSASRPIRMAATTPPNQGYVLDYVSLNAHYTDYVFQRDTTYYLSGTLTFSGTITFEGGTVLKYATNTSILAASQVIFDAGAYYPVVFTAKDDNTVGESISGSTGSPSGYYANPALSMYFLAGHQLSGLRISYAKLAISSPYTSLTLNNAQFVNCDCGISCGNSPLTLNNSLFVNVNTNFLLTATATAVAANNVTFDNARVLVMPTNYPPGSYLQLTNCILANVTNVVGTTIYAGNNGFYKTAPLGSPVITNTFYPFKPTGAAGFYLTNGCAFFNAGTSNVDAADLASLSARTTYPPIVVSNISIHAVTSYSPQAQRDNNAHPDLGYHYDPLDYVFGGVNMYSNVTFTAGTAIGYFELPGSGGPGYGISIFDKVILALNGTASQPCTVARYSSVQEGSTGLWKDKGYLAGITVQSLSGGYSMSPTNAGQIWPTFTRHYVLTQDSNHYRELNALTWVAANNSEFYGGDVGTYWVYLNFTNCLFDRTGINNLGGNAARLAMRNCTLHGGVVDIYKAGLTWPVWIEDCAFDRTTLTVDDNSSGNTNITYCDYNAFVTNYNRLPMHGTHDVIVTDFNWQSSWLGNYYLPASSSLINHGSLTADKFGLYHFTTQTSQTAEAATIVDIGYHYVADGCGGVDTVWVEDAVPGGATQSGDGGDSWTWASTAPVPFSGLLASRSNIGSGEHQHIFYSATSTLTVNTGDTLIAYVYLDAANAPGEVMLQWNDGSWEHRAYWGANSIAFGTSGTVSRHYMGALPPAGQWVRLEVPASAVGLEGHVLNGLAFTLYGGRATWDYAGKSGGTLCYDTDGDGIPDYIEDANGNGVVDAGETSFTNGDTDGDGLSDSEEAKILLDADNPSLGYLNPLQPDTGGTGIYDGQKDSDHDGISNLGELRHYGSNPANAHTFNLVKNDAEYFFTAEPDDANTMVSLEIGYLGGGLFGFSISGASADATYDLYYVNNLAAPRWQWRRVYTGIQCDDAGSALFMLAEPDPYQGYFEILDAADDDGDGLSNGYETWFNYGGQHTIVDDYDTDLDGMYDNWEVEYGLNPTSLAGNDGASGNPDGDLDYDMTPLTNVKEYSYGGGYDASYDPLKIFDTTANRPVVSVYADNSYPSCEETSFTIYRNVGYGGNYNNPLTVYYSVGGTLSYDAGDYSLSPAPPDWPRIDSATIPIGQDHITVTVDASGVSPHPGDVNTVAISLTPYAVSPDPQVSSPSSWAYVLDWHDNRATITFDNQYLRPYAYDQYSQTCPEVPKTIVLQGYDSCGNNLTFSLVSGPSHGSLGTITSIDAGSASVVYTPNSPFCGQDSFTFKVNDGLRDSAPATVAIDVGDPNPVANCRDVMTGVNTPVTFTVSGSQTCSGNLAFTPVDGAGPYAGTLGTMAQVDADHASVTYTPGSATFEGPDYFYFNADDCRAVAQNSVTINVVSGPVLTTDCRADRIVLHWTVPEWLESQYGDGYFNSFKIYRCATASGSCTPTTLYATVTEPGARAYVDTGVGSGMTYCYRVTFTHLDQCDGSTVYESPFSNTDCNQECSPTVHTNGIDVAFILDNTGSMTQGPLTNLQNSIEHVLNDLDTASGGNYRLALVTPDEDQVDVRLNFSSNNRTAFETALNSSLSAGGGGAPESTDECLNTILNALAASGRTDPRGCSHRSSPIQINDFTPGFRAGALKLVVLITDAEPGGFCDSSDGGYQAGIYAQEAGNNCVKINAIQIGNNSGVAPIMQNYYQTSCGWYEQLGYDGVGIAEDVARMFYVPGYCNCP